MDGAAAEMPDGRRYGERLTCAPNRTYARCSRFIGFVPLAASVRRTQPGALWADAVSSIRGSACRRLSVSRQAPSATRFTRRGGIFRRDACLAGPLSQPIYRFADFNAGWYSPQRRPEGSVASGIPLAPWRHVQRRRCRQTELGSVQRRIDAVMATSPPGARPRSTQTQSRAYALAGAPSTRLPRALPKSAEEPQDHAN